MTTFFIACTAFGAAALVLQMLLAMIGLGDSGDVHDGPAFSHGVGDADGHHGHVADGLHLFTVRTVTAGLAFFGLTGWWALMARGTPGWFAVLAALLPGALAMVGTAVLMRTLLQLESDGSLQLRHAIGQPATVYLSIPGAGEGQGKVTLTLQGRTVECAAVSSGPALPTGAAVLIVDVRADGVLEVFPGDA